MDDVHVDAQKCHYIRCRDGNYYFVRRVPDDVKLYYSSERISMSLRTKSNGVAIRATKSICQRLDDYWLGLRMQKMDIQPFIW